jgi:uncharacterized protein (TIGR03790 family)
VAVALLALSAGPAAAPAGAEAPIGPAELGVVYNAREPASRRIAEYYAERRGIPAQNVTAVSFPQRARVLDPEAFAGMKAQVDAALPEHVQALALTWSSAYRVGCMSVTTAFAAGFDRGFCSRPCAETRESPLYRADTHRPWDDFGWRPAMLLPARSFAAARDLIERGIASDHSFPVGTAYLVSSTDAARNVRAALYPAVDALLGPHLDVEIVQGNALAGRRDVLFYFTGLKRVPRLAGNRYLPGAVADHLTSFGGVLRGGPQMPASRWIRAGATGSYGAVVEPCNYPGKFPSPLELMRRYLGGEPLIEAYWKSVAQPGEGLFLGEPLAIPFGRHGKGS